MTEGGVGVLRMSYMFRQLTVFRIPYKDISTLSYLEFSDKRLHDSQETRGSQTKPGGAFRASDGDSCISDPPLS